MARRVYEEYYLASDDPRRQSGFGGDEARWEAARRPIVRAIDRPASYLDVGGATGYLLESLVRWSPCRIEPYGLDFSPRLVALARASPALGGSLLRRRRARVGARVAAALRLSFARSSSTRPRSGGASSSSACSGAWWRPA
ncbi:MAG TPA: class I SAM-dependent methyltransferase [Gaiellaceae bacterium]|nr:class I SAM-dependent methyltransferase [Gaiellaceae bacterium]